MAVRRVGPGPGPGARARGPGIGSSATIRLRKVHMNRMMFIRCSVVARRVYRVSGNAVTEECDSPSQARACACRWPSRKKEIHGCDVAARAADGAGLESNLSA